MSLIAPSLPQPKVRAKITNGTTEYNIMFSVLREFSGAKRNVMLHAFFVAYVNKLIKTSLANHVEGTQDYYNTLQSVGSSQSQYQEIFDQSPQQYQTKGLDLVRDFACALELEANTKKLMDIAGVEGFDIEPMSTLDSSYFYDINYLGFDVKVISAAEQAARTRPGK